MTLIELIVTVAVLGVLSAIAYPAFSSLVKNQRLDTLLNDLLTSLEMARNEAISRNALVSVCASADGQACGGSWRNWLVVSEDGSVLRVHAVNGSVQISASVDRITYSPVGLAVTPVNSTVVLCIPGRGLSRNQRWVKLASVSRTSNGVSGDGGRCPALESRA